MELKFNSLYSICLDERNDLFTLRSVEPLLYHLMTEKEDNQENKR